MEEKQIKGYISKTIIDETSKLFNEQIKDVTGLNNIKISCCYIPMNGGSYIFDGFICNYDIIEIIHLFNDNEDFKALMNHIWKTSNIMKGMFIYDS